jgi:hypothetical protein
MAGLAATAAARLAAEEQLVETDWGHGEAPVDGRP